MTRRPLFAALLLTLCALPAFAGFGDVAGMLDSHHGLKRVPVPGIGLARFVVWMVHPKGVHDFEFATYEGRSEFSRGEMAALVAHAGAGYQPVVQVRSSRGKGEWTCIYARPAGERIEVLVFTHDSEDTVLVRAEVDAETFAREVHERKTLTAMAR
jgi:hypothetical protein